MLDRLAALLPPCPIRLLTGVSCPGCGLGRAMILALGGHFAAAHAMHPLALPVFSEALMMAIVRVRRRGPFRIRIRSTRYAAAHLAAFIAVWIVRLTTGQLH